MAKDSVNKVGVGKNDSIGRTLMVVVVLCLVCSVIVAGAAVGLKPMQEEQKQLDKQRNILAVAGLMQGDKLDGEQVKTLFGQRIEPRLLDLKSGEFTSGDPYTFDMGKALKDPATSMVLDAAQDPAGIKRRSNIVEVYLVKNEQGNIGQVVLPVYGTGLWSVMYAFVAIDTDGNTVKGLTFYEHGETPGLGGEIENPSWREKWVGKQLFDDGGRPAIRIVKGGANPQDPHGVDGLSGATLTANGVQHTFDFWMGDNGYGPFLKRVREGALNRG